MKYQVRFNLFTFDFWINSEVKKVTFKIQTNLLFGLSHLFDFRIDSAIRAMAEHQILDGGVARLGDETTSEKKI